MKPTTKTILFELLHLDAPLAVAELVHFGETLKKIPWTKEEFLHHPYCVFERKNNALYFLYDQNGIDWKIKHAGQFDETVLSKQIHEKYACIENIIKNEKALNREELSNFISLVRNYWTWFDGMYWMIEHYDKAGLVTSELMKTRKYTEYFMPGLIAVIRKSFAILVPQYKNYVDVLSIDEVLNEKIPTEDILKERKITYAYTDGKLFTSLNEVKNKYQIELHEEKTVITDELKGQVAYPGKVRGEVKIVKHRDDMKKFQKGNIIVSSTTTPDFLPIMQMCAAIISEHGGIICHASITSRELKIPCVVGVKGATKILKDGDVVEVDAEKGIVTIL